MASQKDFSSKPIAIVGSSCRFPGQSTTPSKLHDLLREPRDVRRSFDPELLNLQRFYNENPDAPGSTNVKNQGYLLAEDSRVFDASFFSVSPYEAESMDPQLRVMLESVYEAFESAGWTLDQMKGSQTSVHVGVMASDYYDIQVRDPETVPLYSATGTHRSTLSNRVSYTFDLHGPSITLDTACSSSLVALHQAVQGLQAGDAECAIVGGVNLIFDAMLYIMLSNLHMLSPDSQSRMWDKTVNGYARGEGVAVVVLKPLEQALKDGDQIEAIIRGTGVNSDGASPGLTMPTVEAQAALIRETYKRAGLDPVKNRCQFFECHGTGTPAGDPVEAGAIYEAMIRGSEPSEKTDPMYVGSIKTLVGHLEGGAGLAGVLKALLAIKHKTIFPNLLFNELNPKIEPFYGQLQIPTTALPWPELPAGEPRRVSVNNFGFGGTNAHAILESYEPGTTPVSAVSSKATAGSHLSPFVLSGHSSSSLLGNCQSLLKYLTENPSVDLANLGWMLNHKRTAHRLRTFFTSQTHDKLVEELEGFLAQHRKATNKDDVGIRSREVERPRVLGVFTGQGAQWPAMGRDLLDKSPVFRHALERCEEVLAALPDGPEWSLIDELSKDGSDSRVGEAAISQPLCTAVQLGLIEVLKTSGVQLDAAVGHSSGEMAAVHASGMISAAAAIQIAYYRGKFAHLARGTADQTGSMMAVGISHEDAKAFCLEQGYKGRIGVAAVNAPKSVTLSGDLEAIEKAKEHFDSKQVFARQLKVDTAYHSYHMDRCAKSYLDALKSCKIQVQKPTGGCLWVSSVKGDTSLLEGDLESLKGPYWVENMVNAVLFAPAIQHAVEGDDAFDLAVEVGPHPGLKGPTTQTLQLASGSPPPYLGTLQRGGNDTEALGETVGSLWCHLGPEFVNFDGFSQAFEFGEPLTSAKFDLLKDLPPYAWDHDRIYWRESRISRNFRKAVNVRHPLLGRRVPDDTDKEMRWRNVLKLNEMPWAQGHVISGEVLLPGTSYISMSCEAAKAIAGDTPIRRIDVQDIKIRVPVIVPDSREGLETSFTVRVEDSSKDADHITADFSYYYADTSGSMEQSCSGKIIITLGEASQSELPPAGVSPPGLYPVNSDEGYDMFEQNGLTYTGIFRRLQDVQRRLDYAVAKAEWTPDELATKDYALHPAILDVSWQNMFHGRADPAVGKLPTAILPVHIKRVSVNPNVELEDGNTLGVTTETFITARNGVGVTGDVHIYSSSGATVVQMESVVLDPVAPQSEDQDRQLFFDTVFKTDPSMSLIEPPQHDPNSKTSQRTKELAADIERVVLFYIQKVLKGLSSTDRSSLTWYHQKLVEAWDSSLELIREGRHPVAEKSWLADKPDILDTIFAKWPDTVDLELVRAVGDNFLDFLKRKEALLEVIMKDNMAGRLYSEGCGFTDVNGGMVGVLQQIAHKFPQAKYLEIGAGTGSTTDYILRTIGNAFYTYTYTDISPAFFEQAADRFNDFRGKTIFKTLDVENDVTPQGYQKHSYDVVVASNVLHATASINRTLEHARSLLKPGGYLLLVEITGTQMMRTTFCVGGLPGWWLGAKEGRKTHPGLTTEEWDTTLQETGYSGVDLVMHDIPGQHCLSFMASQAVDDTVLQLREPLEYIDEAPQVKSLLVIGGKTLPVSKAVNAIQKLVGPTWRNCITVASDLESIDFSRLGSGTDVLCLQELDKALFSEPLTPRKLKALQTLFVAARNVLWLTTKRRTDSPGSNMVAGMARAVAKELPHLNLQLLDLDSVSSPSGVARSVVEAFVRMKVLSVHDYDEEPLLWPQEPELVVEGSEVLVPRVRPDRELNDRYNARFRAVSREVDGLDVSVGLVSQRGKLALAEKTVSSDSDSVSVRVEHSLSIPGGTCLSVGRLVDSDKPVVAVSESNTSIVHVSRDSVASIDEKDCTAAALEGIANRIMVAGLINSSPSKGPALLYNPTSSLAAIFEAESRQNGLEPLIASPNASESREGWVSVHPQSSVHAVRRLLPSNVAAFLDCSGAKPTAIHSLLPSDCKTYRWNASLFQLGLRSSDTTEASLKAAYAGLSSPKDTEIEVLSVKDLTSADASILDRTHITSWKTTTSLTSVVQPPDTSIVFCSDKTYLMVGMANGLGLSVCEFAVKQGAKNLVITSRKPNLHPQWLTWARNQGANIHVRPMDATDRSALQSTISFIKEELPPLGGVCNAAMVLSDKLFVDMDVDAMNATLKPKVDVSKHLDDILSDTPLDFFVMFSSALAITGSHGQANYHAANMFMTALAAQRRQAGRAGSVMHIGYVSDVGYFTRADLSSKEYVSRMHFGPISETDVHHAFTEAVFAGKPDSGRASCEVGVGLEPLDAPLDDEHQTAWSSDPRFAHFLPTTSVGKNEDAQAGRDDVKEQIQNAESETEVVEIVQEALVAKLESLLQLSPGSIDTDALLTKLGIDSLVAVEIRTWFLKKIGIDVPVVKILGRNSVAQLCIDASKKMLTTMDLKGPVKGLDSVSDTPDDSREISDAGASPEERSGDVSPPSDASEEEDIQSECPQEEDKKEEKAVAEAPSMDFGHDIIATERMSAAQSRIFVLGNLMNDPTAYSLMIRYDLENLLDVDRLRNALTSVMQHHESLRTCFFARPEDNTPVQGLLSFPVRRFKHVPDATDEDIEEALEESRTKVWDIEHGETLGLTVLSRSPASHTLVLAYHHIIFDASGMRRFMRDLNAAYNKRALKHDFKTCLEFAAAEVSDKQSQLLDANMQYWRAEFSTIPDALPPLPMSAKTSRSGAQKVYSYHGERMVDEPTARAAKRCCQTLGITPFQFHLAVVQVLLTQALGTDDICIGIADANRHEAKYMETIGFFLNLLPVRFRLAGGDTFAAVAQNTSRQVGEALEKSVPFDILLDRLNISRSSAHTPLFQVLVNYRLAMTKEVPFGSGSLVITDAEEGRNPYDITFSFLESQSGGLGVTLDCLESLYGADATERLLDMYVFLLKGLVEDVNVKVDECQIYNPEDISTALKVGQGLRDEISGPATVSEKFQQVCSAYPERVAIRDRDAHLTYEQLAGRVNSIATALLSAGHGAGTRVAVLCEPSNDLVASLLAILHIGAIYVPLDVSLPPARHAAMSSSCNPGVLLCHKPTNELVDKLINELNGELPLLDLDDVEEAQKQVPCEAKPDSPSFIFYTSGTTGKPKGVVLTQGGVINWVVPTIKEYGFDSAPSPILQQSSLGFDMSLIQIFTALCSGGTVITVPQELRRDPVQLTQLLQQHDVAMTFAVPSEYLLWLRYGREVLRQCEQWRWLFIGGEPFPPEVKRELLRLGLSQLQVRNYYGPTEITFTATRQPIALDEEEKTDAPTPIGKAQPNYSICVLDAKNKPLPVGLRGEICIGGPGVALGYWEMPAETEKRFIADPTSTGSSSKWYRSGDQGKLSPDGSVIFLGRISGDTQVKLRGLRIELAEVEGALLKAGESLLSTAVVNARDGDLVAHVILVPGKQVDRHTVKQKLLSSLTLPQYMHPSRIIIADDLPRANSGKIDRQAVAKLPLTSSENEGAGEGANQLTLREVELKLLWRKVLPDPYQALDAESEFFLEGGNSLRLTQLQNEIKETLGVFLSTRELYSAPTLRQMAARIDSQRGEQTGNDEDITWSDETKIPEELLELSKNTTRQPREKKTKGINVLMTGGAGVLGNAILQSLVEDPSVAKIHCVAVLPEDEARLPTTDKIVRYTGSLSSPALGLSPSECESLQTDMDLVIHAGGNGHCLNSYASVRRPNVQSTHFLASLCIPRSVPFLYVSSQRVPSLLGLKSLGPVPVLVEPGKTGDTGYMASRWVSERFLDAFSRADSGSFPVEIHRPCLFYGDRAPKSDALNGVLTYTSRIRGVPRFKKVEGYIDFKEVDIIGKDVAASAVALAGRQKSGVRYRHHSSGRKVPFPQWAEYMTELTGEKFETLELPEWIARAREAGIDPLIATYLEGVIEKEELGLFPYLGEAAEQEEEDDE